MQEWIVIAYILTLGTEKVRQVKATNTVTESEILRNFA